MLVDNIIYLFASGQSDIFGFGKPYTRNLPGDFTQIARPPEIIANQRATH